MAMHDDSVGREMIGTSNELYSGLVKACEPCEVEATKT